MKCSAFIATSADGYIAKSNGAVDWLHSAGNGKELPTEQADMGLYKYLASVDCMIMGRKCMEVIAAMNLTPEQWFYGDLKIIVLSNTLTEAPDNLKDKVEMYSGDLIELITQLESRGHKSAYIDGGTTIQNFINLRLLNEITITLAPLLLGGGIPLFGLTNQEIKLEQSSSLTYLNDFIQIKYALNYG